MSELPLLLGEQAMSRQNQQLEQQYQAEQQAAQQQQQMQQVQMQNQQALQMEKAKAEIAETRARADHYRSKELQDDSHKKQLQLSAISELGKLEQAKAKPKAKTA